MNPDCTEADDCPAEPEGHLLSCRKFRREHWGCVRAFADGAHPEDICLHYPTA
jgi:hypothetical protein